MYATTLITILAGAVLPVVAYGIYLVFIQPRYNPLRNLPGPPANGPFHNHLGLVMDPSLSPKVHEALVKQFGRTVALRTFLPWDQRLFTLDSTAITHVLKHMTVYEKPWQSRQLITSLIGCGMLAAEGLVHKRQRRVATPAFSIQNLRELVPLVFAKGCLLRKRWSELIVQANTGSAKLDVCHWVSRATFDVIGSAGFDYEFNAIQDETNELFNAYKEMFEVAISQHNADVSAVIAMHLPVIDVLYPSVRVRTVRRCQGVIRSVAGRLIQEKKRKVAEAEESGTTYHGKDLLSLLLKSNVASDLPPEQRISDDDILHNINTFMFAGSDTSSLAITWTLFLLAKYPAMQTRVRTELLAIEPAAPIEKLTPEEVGSLHSTIADLPFLDNVMRESLRLIPPVHSSIRVATRDDDVPTSAPVKTRMPDGSYAEMWSVCVPKGSFVHIPIEGFNLDREVWGPDSWSFNPDRWDNLPEAVASQPGLYSNTLTFSAGPRSCIGLRFSMIEMKTFLYVLLTNFVFAESDEKVGKANVVLTRPYVMGKPRDGSQCPLLVTPYIRQCKE